ncbi:MAG: endonuclease V [Elusimicrobiota bacterium]
MGIIFQKSHSWNLEPDDAVAVQNRLRLEIQKFDRFSTPEEINFIGGTYACVVQTERLLIAGGVVVLDYAKGMVIAEHQVIIREFDWMTPYSAEFLAFAHLPVIIECMQKLETVPEITFVHGHGYAHPRAMGIATHLGILGGIPTIGCANKLLFGEAEDPPPVKGGYTFIKDAVGQVIGYALTAKDKTKPIYVSAGNMVTLELASDMVIRCCKKNRLPEPLRSAREVVKNMVGHMAEFEND